jgi:carbamoyltransferase
MARYILGISCYYHDSAACILKEGVILAAAEEERFSRVKHDSKFPQEAIRYCMKFAGIKSSDIDCVAFYEKPLLKYERILSTFAKTYPFSFWYFYKTIPSWVNEKLRIEGKIRKSLKKICKEKFDGQVLFIPHHMSHAASSFFASPFKESAIMTFDGVGEWGTTTLGFGSGNSIKQINEIDFPHSLGLLYSTITAFLGFDVNNDEYKVMGLAAYGQPLYLDDFRKIIDVNEDGSYRLEMSYFSYEYKERMFSPKLMSLLGLPRLKGARIAKRHENIASSLQRITEEIIIKAANYAHSLTKSDDLCLAGGVALNCVANGKILANTPFKRLYIQPAAGDSGGAIGAALFAYRVIIGGKNRYEMDSAYLGPEFSDEEIKDFLEKNRIAYQQLERADLLREAAKMISRDEVVGWLQGRMEFGPRALGSRSILANPCSPKMKDILNVKVKYREEFRPFAPAVCVEDARKFFEISGESPFMLQTFNVRKESRKKMPSITHVDGTARVQTVTRSQNPLFYDLIREFEKFSGVPVLINTSFNVRGEPIVCTPKEAYDCFMKTGMDCLFFGSFMITK